MLCAPWFFYINHSSCHNVLCFWAPDNFAVISCPWLDLHFLSDWTFCQGSSAVHWLGSLDFLRGGPAMSMCHQSTWPCPQTQSDTLLGSHKRQGPSSQREVGNCGSVLGVVYYSGQLVWHCPDVLALWWNRRHFPLWHQMKTLCSFFCSLPSKIWFPERIWILFIVV